MSLARKASAGALWTISSSLVGRLIGLTGTLFLTHSIAPADYGQVVTAFITVWITSSLLSLGFGQYIVAHPKAGRDVVFHATFYHIVIGLLGLGLLLLLSPHLPLFFPDASGMLRYLPWMAAANVVSRVSFLPSRLLARDMRFRALAIRSFAREAVYSGVLLALLYCGLGVWAVVYAIVARTVVAEIGVVLSVDWRDWAQPVKIRWETTRELMSFLPLGAANLLHALSRRGDNLLIASLFGPNAVGAYNLAYNLADIPASHIGEQIGGVLLPSFAALDTTEDRKRALLRALGLLSLIVFPLAVGLGAIADTLVSALFNADWALIAPMLTVLSVLGIVRPLSWLVDSYLQAMRRPWVLLVLETARTTILFAAIIALSTFDVLWACGAAGFAYSVHALASFWVVSRTDEIRIPTLIAPCVAALLSCTPMMLAVLSVRHFGGVFEPGSVAMLAVEIIAGGLTYVAAAFVLAPRTVRDAIRLLTDLTVR